MNEYLKILSSLADLSKFDTLEPSLKRSLTQIIDKFVLAEDLLLLSPMLCEFCAERFTETPDYDLEELELDMTAFAQGYMRAIADMTSVYLKMKDTE